MYMWVYACAPGSLRFSCHWELTPPTFRAIRRQVWAWTHCRRCWARGDGAAARLYLYIHAHQRDTWVLLSHSLTVHQCTTGTMKVSEWPHMYQLSISPLMLGCIGMMSSQEITLVWVWVGTREQEEVKIIREAMDDWTTSSVQSNPVPNYTFPLLRKVSFRFHRPIIKFTH